MARFGHSKITDGTRRHVEGFHPDRRSLLSLGVGAALSATGLHPAQAQDYPARPIQVLVPFAGGSASDVITRILLNRMSTSLGQAFVVDNRPGAGGNIGTAAAAHAAADGYTLLMSTSGPLAANKSLYKELPYEPLKDLAPIGLFAALPNVVAINSRLPPKSLRELIEYAKEHPRELNYGTVGVGSSQHLAAAYFEQLTGTEITHVPYRNIAAYTPDFITGQVPLGFQLLPNVIGLIRNGDARPLAVASDKRMTALPDVPTAAEAGLKDYESAAWLALLAQAGLKDYESAAWLALLAPANTDKTVIDKLYKAMVEAVNDPKVRARFVEQGAEPLVMDPQGLKDFMTLEAAKWATIIKKIGIEPM
ncbi:Bug family tripartite tricarboxylate transporter substrate binding protein (plasmid) [Bradyrhizobium lupini]|uniref:Bug family tripartite tricarboxylate transporter substrate binding protein n=1 Tax=Rhizobium lupini TaxID=136996 RepID=UPI00366CDC5D